MKMNTLNRGMVGGIIALMLVGITVSAPRVEAQTASLASLQAQIQTLLAQITALQAQLQAMQTGTTVCVAPAQNLAFGDHNSGVTTLQTFLISRGYTIPAGATGFFGSQTQNALRQFQAAQGISPALGLNYGPITRARIQSICVVPTPTPQPTPTPTPQPQPEPDLRGEASLERFTVRDGNDTDLEEGDTSVEVMEVSFRVRDGDASLNRFEIGVTPDPANDEQDPWDTFEEIAIWNGSQELATVDASREQNWREDSPRNDDYTIRLSGFDYVMRENRDIELTVTASVQNSVRGSDNGELWTIFVPDEGLRALDADRAAVYAGDTADAVTLNLDRAGASDELITRRSDEDPDASVLRLDENRNSGYLEVFAFDLDTDDSENDIEIRELPIQFTVNNGTLADFVRNVRLTIDGDTYTDETITDGATGIVTFEFDRNELIIEAGDRVTVLVEIDFQSLDSTDESTTIVGHIDADDIDAEGGDDLASDQLQGAATGEMHTMYTRGTEGSDETASAIVTVLDGPNNDYVTFSMTVELTAFGQDVYIPIGTTGMTYQLEDATGSPLGASGTAIVNSSARERSGYFHIPEGSTESLTLDVTYQPGIANTTARLQLISVNFNDTTAAPDQTWKALPETKYRTPTRTIVN